MPGHGPADGAAGVEPGGIGGRGGAGAENVAEVEEGVQVFLLGWICAALVVKLDFGIRISESRRQISGRVNGGGGNARYGHQQKPCLAVFFFCFSCMALRREILGRFCVLASADV